MDTRRLVSPEELIERIQSYSLQVVVVEADFIFDEVFESANKLRFVGICRGSVNNVDIEAATKQINDNVLNKQHKFIGEILLEKGWITKEEIEIVLNKLSENE